MKHEDVSVPNWLNVSRETLDRLFAYCDLVKKWNPAINLVSKAGLSTLWDRHILDSAQIFLRAPSHGALWCDLGSGGGFPGIVLAIMAKELRPDMSMILVESDRRKSVFLSETSRQLGIHTTVKTQRIEDLEPQNVDVLTARALAPLLHLCAYAHRHLNPEGLALFPKGATAVEEIDQARKHWRFDCTTTQSLTDPAAQVLAVREVRHA